MRYFLKFALLFWLAVPLALAQAPKADTQRRRGQVETILGPGDVVRITVFQNPDLTVEARISEAGQINFPLIGAVTVGGLSDPGGGAAHRDDAARRRLRAPAAGDDPDRADPQQPGLGARPGRQARAATRSRSISSKVSEMIAAAGGVVPGGADVVTLVGTRNGEPIKLDIDLPAILQSGRAELDVQVENGDIIYVDRAPTIYIYGEVQRPGQLRLERGMTLMQALAAGGGLTARGTERGIRVHRRDATGAGPGPASSS